MARQYSLSDMSATREAERRKALSFFVLSLVGAGFLASLPFLANPKILFLLAAFPAVALLNATRVYVSQFWLERERRVESAKRGGRPVIGMPPKRDAFANALEDSRSRGKRMIDKYMVGFDLNTGDPLWVNEDDLCSHAAVFAKTGVGKTLWLESMIFQQMARGRASGCTFIDAKRDSGTLAQVILMALVTGRIEDLVVVDPFDSVHCYNFVMTKQRADVKARKVLRAGLPPTSDASTTKHYDRLAADSIYRMVRAMESFGLSWSIHDIAVALSAFNLSYPHLKSMLTKIGARQAIVELGHLASSYRTAKGSLDTSRITDNLRGIASELHAVAGSQMGHIFCTNYTDLVLTDAILRGKIIYFMLPRLEEAESAARMIKLFREDLEVSIGEITSSRQYHLEDPHLVIIDEGSSTFGPTWANLFELARKGRFALLFGAQSTGGLTDQAIGLSEAFYERVMANVNLKVMMRVGDNRTAGDMAEWFGKVATTKKSYGAGVTSSTSKGSGIDLSGRTGAGETQTINIAEDEDDLVSADELKHEMSAEKGLAWFDLGDGRIVKGRAFWFDADLPDMWEGREHLTRLQRFEQDGLGLAEWVDEQIFGQEKRDSEGMSKPPSGPKKSEPPKAAEEKKEELPVPDGPFRLGMLPKGGRPRGAITTLPKADPAPVPAPKEKMAAEKQKQGAAAKSVEIKTKKGEAPQSQKPQRSSMKPVGQAHAKSSPLKDGSGEAGGSSAGQGDTANTTAKKRRRRRKKKKKSSTNGEVS